MKMQFTIVKPRVKMAITLIPDGHCVLCGKRKSYAIGACKPCIKKEARKR